MVRICFLGAFHKYVQYLVDRNMKQVWPSIPTEHLCYKYKKQSKDISMFPPLSAQSNNAPEFNSI